MKFLVSFFRKPTAPSVAIEPRDLTQLTDALAGQPQLTALQAAGFFQIDLQFRLFEALDARSGNILAVGSAVLPVSFVILNLRDGDPPLASLLCLYLALAAYLVLLIFYLRSVAVQYLEARPELSTLKHHAIDGRESAETVFGWIAAECDRAIDENRVTLQIKQRRTGLATLALYAEGLFLTGAAIAAGDLIPRAFDRFL